MTKLSQVEDGVASIVKRYGRVVAVITAAGGRTRANVGAFTEAAVDTWMQIIELHLTGVLNLYYATLPHMCANHRGALIAISAVEAYRGLPDSAVYSTSKAAVAVLTKTLVREYKLNNIRFNSIIPPSKESLLKSCHNSIRFRART